MRPKFRWGADLIVPLLLLALALFAPPPLLRYLAIGLLAIRLLALGYVLAARSAITVERVTTLVHTNRYAPFTCTLKVRNGSPFPVHFLTVADRIGSFVARQPAQFVVGLGPWEERSFAYELEGHERGEYVLGPVDVAGTDAFGFFPFRRLVAAPGRVVVYPNIFALDLQHKRGLPSGSLKVLNKLYEDVTRYRSLREYQPGDELKRINWKASARLGSLYAMEYVPSIYFPVLVLLNLAERDYPLSQRAHLVERAVETAASLVFHFVGIGQEVGLITNGRLGAATSASGAATGGDAGSGDGAVVPYTIAPPRAGYGHAVNLLEQLARVQTAEREESFVDIVMQGGVPVASRSRVVVVTPPPRAEQRGGLLALRRRGFDVELFLVSTHQTRREDLQVEGLPTHTVGGYGRELVRG